MNNFVNLLVSILMALLFEPAPEKETLFPAEQIRTSMEMEGKNQTAQEQEIYRC